MVESSQDWIAQSKANDRGAHARGLIKGIGGQKVFSWYQQWDRRLFSGGEKLGQNRLKESHDQQSPISPAQTKPVGAGDQEERGAQHKQCPQAVGGHHHPAFRPAVDPHTRNGSEHHRWDGVGHVDASSQQGDALGSGLEIHANRRSDFSKRSVAIRCICHPVLGDQIHHQHDVELIRELGEDLPDPEASEAIEMDHGLKAAATLWVGAGGQGRVRTL